MPKRKERLPQLCKFTFKDSHLPLSVEAAACRATQRPTHKLTQVLKATRRDAQNRCLCNTYRSETCKLDSQYTQIVRVITRAHIKATLNYEVRNVCQQTQMRNCLCSRYKEPCHYLKNMVYLLFLKLLGHF